MTMTVKCMIALWRSLVRNLHLYIHQTETPQNRQETTGAKTKENEQPVPPPQQ